MFCASAIPSHKPEKIQQSDGTLRFSPTAWAKLLFLRDLGDTEVGGFGIVAADDLLRVEDVELVRQTCGPASVAFEDQSVADFFDRQVDAGRQPEQFGRIWVHTYPGNGPQPSMTDEETFQRVFGRTQWAVMFILARGGATYARLQFNVGPGGALLLPVEVDYRRAFSGSNYDAWREEYQANVVEEFQLVAPRRHGRKPFEDADFFALDGWPDFSSGFLDDELLPTPHRDEENIPHDAPF